MEEIAAFIKGYGRYCVVKSFSQETGEALFLITDISETDGLSVGGEYVRVI